MRKEILLPAVAAAGGVVGFAFRRWELATAFEADTGLPIDGAPATMALIVLSVVMAAVLALLCRGKYPAFTGYDQAFQAKGNTAYATAGILSAFLLLGAAGMLVYEFLQAAPGDRIYTNLLVAALALASCFCVMGTVQNNFKGLGKGRLNFTLLLPAYTCGVWLIAAYQPRAGDPVQLDYVFALFAIIASLLGLYFHAAFGFTKGRPFCAVFFALLGVYFSITTLADGHTLGSMLLYAFAIVYLLLSAITLLHNAGRPELLARPEGDANDTTEGTPDES